MTLANNRQENGAETEGEQMGTPARAGGYEWRAEIATARMIKGELRSLVQKCLQRPDANLFVQMALKLGELDDIINRLDEIGRNTK
jgi:hypothetical protein